MLNIMQATQIIHKNLPDGEIQHFVDYNGMYIFVVYTPDPDEGIMDPFYSVDKTTGELKEFPIFLGNNFNEVMPLLEEAAKKK